MQWFKNIFTNYPLIIDHLEGKILRLQSEISHLSNQNKDLYKKLIQKQTEETLRDKQLEEKLRTILQIQNDELITKTLIDEIVNNLFNKER